MLLADLPQPDTATARLAREVATTYCSPALLNHSVRSYFFAAAYGLSHGIAFDEELLYVSSVFHDLGLVKEFDSHTVPFEEAGGHVVWVFAAGAGWPVERRRRAAEIVVHHMWDIEPADDPEGHLLAVATSLDISGANPDLWPAELRAELVGTYPRLGLAEEFVRCFADQARRKPDGLAAESVRNGIAQRMANNVLDDPLGLRQG
ncbi:MAG: HD domain-containing protein [Propionibacteriaceae bacterium]